MTTVRATRVRLGIVVLLFVTVVINYMDRANVSVAGARLSDELQLSPQQLGWIFSAFGWTYAALQIPGGWLVDRIRPRVLYAGCIAGWSLTTLLQGVAPGFGTLLGLRLATGAGEAPAYPINNRVVTAWFPEQERAGAIAFYTSGQYLGLAFLHPLMALAMFYLGWRGLFLLTGAVGMVWAVIWYLLYHEPRSHPRANAAELDHIERGGGLTGIRDIARTGPPEGGSLGRRMLEVLRHRKLWGIYLGQFAVTSTLWFFLTWFPTYLERYRGLSVTQTGWLAPIPFLAAFVGVLVSGTVSDWLTRRGVSADVARKTPLIAGLVLSLSIVGANYVTEPFWVIVFLTMAFFGNGLASIAWVFVSLLAPAHVMGLAGGVFNFFGNLPGIVVPIVIGHLVSGGNFAPALVFIALISVGGVLSYVFLVGKVERIEVEPAG